MKDLKEYITESINVNESNVIDILSRINKTEGLFITDGEDEASIFLRPLPTSIISFSTDTEFFSEGSWFNLYQEFVAEAGNNTKPDFIRIMYREGSIFIDAMKEQEIINRYDGRYVVTPFYKGQYNRHASAKWLIDEFEAAIASTNVNYRKEVFK